jgi:dGTPase
LSGALCRSRHPLTFLVEAADDICNCILDIEDGARLGHVDEIQAQELLGVLANKHSSFSVTRAGVGSALDRIGYLRGLAVGTMIDEAAEVFMANEEALLRGKLSTSFADMIPSASGLQALKDLASDKCYRNPEVLEIELAGYEALGGLLEIFIPAVAAGPTERTRRQAKAVDLLKRRGVPLPEGSAYERVIRVTDHVSGMTDRHALSTFRRLKGIAVPGRVA